MLKWVANFLLLKIYWQTLESKRYFKSSHRKMLPEQLAMPAVTIADFGKRENTTK